MTDDAVSLEGMESANQAASENLNAGHFQGESASTIAANEAKTVTPAWLYATDIPGVGDKPEWFLEDKYSNISQQAEAYLGMQKRLGEFAGAPKDGYNVEKYKEEVNVESPFIHKLLESSKGLNMTQQGLDQVMSLFIEYEKANTPNHEEFIKTLNPQETDMTKNVFNWAKNNFTSEETEILSGWLSDKNSLNILSKMRAMSRENRIPSSNQGTSSTPLPTLEDIQSIMNNNRDKYNNDEAFRNRIEKQRAEVFQRMERS
ncbi:MAG: hypothetical protein V3V84_00675 [Candidatus Bathyarchaeia archaeon]